MCVFFYIFLPLLILLCWLAGWPTGWDFSSRLHSIKSFSESEFWRIPIDLQRFIHRFFCFFLVYLGLCVACIGVYIKVCVWLTPKYPKMIHSVSIPFHFFLHYNSSFSLFLSYNLHTLRHTKHPYVHSYLVSSHHFSLKKSAAKSNF